MWRARTPQNQVKAQNSIGSANFRRDEACSPAANRATISAENPQASLISPVDGAGPSPAHTPASGARLRSVDPRRDSQDRNKRSLAYGRATSSYVHSVGARVFNLVSPDYHAIQPNGLQPQLIIGPHPCRTSALNPYPWNAAWACGRPRL